jgi:hypothetical protein
MGLGKYIGIYLVRDGEAGLNFSGSNEIGLSSLNPQQIPLMATTISVTGKRRSASGGFSGRHAPDYA